MLLLGTTAATAAAGELLGELLEALHTSICSSVLSCFVLFIPQTFVLAGVCANSQHALPK
jgi:hypothetical protein